MTKETHEPMTAENTKSTLAEAAAIINGIDPKPIIRTSGNADDAADVDPLMAGIEALKREDPDALVEWTVALPKKVGGQVASVRMDSTDELLIVVSRPSGRFGSGLV